MTRVSLFLGAFLCLLSIGFCEELPALDSWEYGTEAITPLTGYDEIGLIAQNTEQPTFNAQGRKGRGRGRAFQGFFLTSSSSYDLAMIVLGKEKGMVRLGQRMFQLTSVQMERSAEENQTEITEKTVVAQFQATLVAMDSSTSTAAAAGSVQGILIKYPVPNNESNRPHKGRGPVVLQATVQTSEFSGTILALPKRKHKPPMGRGRQGFGRQ